MGRDSGLRAVHGTGGAAAQAVFELSSAGTQAVADHHGGGNQQLCPHKNAARAAQKEVLPDSYRVSSDDLHAQAVAEPVDAADAAARRSSGRRGAARIYCLCAAAQALRAVFCRSGEAVGGGNAGARYGHGACRAGYDGADCLGGNLERAFRLFAEKLLLLKDKTLETGGSIEILE